MSKIIHNCGKHSTFFDMVLCNICTLEPKDVPFGDPNDMRTKDDFRKEVEAEIKLSKYRYMSLYMIVTCILLYMFYSFNCCGIQQPLVSERLCNSFRDDIPP